MKSLKLFYMIMFLNFTSIFMGSNNDANKKAAYQTLASVIPCASPVSLIHEAWHTTNVHELERIRLKLFVTSDKSVMAAIVCVTLGTTAIGTKLTLPLGTKATLFLAAHAAGVVPGVLGIVFVSKKIS
jgi:hypothetical protein